MKFIFLLLAISAAPVMAGKNTDGDYKMFEDAFCRTDDHKKGSDGHEFYKLDDDKAACQAYCDDEDWCSGYEYGSGNKCEIWREKSHEFKTKNADSDIGSSCNWKKNQPNDSHSEDSEDYYYDEVHEDDSEDGDYYYEEHEEDSEDGDYYYEEHEEDSEDSEDSENYYYEEHEEQKEDSEDDYYYEEHEEDYYY